MFRFGKVRAQFSQIRLGQSSGLVKAQLVFTLAVAYRAKPCETTPSLNRLLSSIFCSSSLVQTGASWSRLK